LVAIGLVRYGAGPVVNAIVRSGLLEDSLVAESSHPGRVRRGLGLPMCKPSVLYVAWVGVTD
jgi:hypothetical protein